MTEDSQRKAARGRARPSTADALGTLGFYFLRAQVLHLQWYHIEKEMRASGRIDDLLADVSTGYPAKQWAFWGCYLACLCTVVEGWLEVRPGFTPVDELLFGDAHTIHREQLKEFRHGVMHFNALDNPAFLAMNTEPGFLEWIARLHMQLYAYFRTHSGDQMPSLTALSPKA